MKRSKLLNLMVLCNVIRLKGRVDVDCLFQRFVKGDKVPLHELRGLYGVPDEDIFLMLYSEIFEIQKSKMSISREYRNA
jgi:hypothetical protein